MIPRAMLAVAYATGRVSHTRHVKGDDPDEKGYSGPPGSGLGVRLTTTPHKKILLRDLKRRPRPTQVCRADDDDDDDDDQQMHNYFTNYHTATCFDTIVSSSDSL
jgi:hypothetical protein